MYHLSEKLSHYFAILCTVALKTKLFVYLDVLYIFVVGHNIMSIYKTSHYCNLIQLYLTKKKKKKMTRGLPWVKDQKLCHIPNSPFPREREGGLMAKSLSLSAKI